MGVLSIAFYVYLLCPGVSFNRRAVNQFSQVGKTIWTELLIQEKLTEHSGFKKNVEWHTNLSLSEKKYLEINNSQQFVVCMLNYLLFKFESNPNKFPLSYNSLKCPLQAKKIIRENSTKKNLLLHKQTPPTNAFNWVLR